MYAEIPDIEGNIGFTNYTVEHESKMPLLKTHSHTSKQRGYEASKGTVKLKGKKSEASPQPARNPRNIKHRKPPPHHQQCEERGENVSTKTEKIQATATFPATGGLDENISTQKLGRPKYRHILSEGRRGKKIEPKR